MSSPQYYYVLFMSWPKDRENHSFWIFDNEDDLVSQFIGEAISVTTKCDPWTKYEDFVPELKTGKLIVIWDYQEKGLYWGFHMKRIPKDEFFGTEHVYSRNNWFWEERRERVCFPDESDSDSDEED